MKNNSNNEQKRRQDALQRIDQRLNVLEEQAIALLSNTDYESMTHNQRAQALCRLLTLMTRMEELREKCALLDDDY